MYERSPNRTRRGKPATPFVDPETEAQWRQLAEPSRSAKGESVRWLPRRTADLGERHDAREISAPEVCHADSDGSVGG